MTGSGVPRALNVDDTPATRYLRGRSLRQAGFEVVDAANGGDALAALAVQAFDIVLLDVNLPDMMGYEVCRRIRANPATASIAVLQLSATHHEIGDRVSGLDAGADTYLVEPVPSEVLVATARALVRMRRAEHAVREHARELERKVVERTRRLELAVADMEAFTFSIAHDLRAPLRAIRGFADALGEEAADAPGTRAYVQRIAESVSRMDQLLADLLSYSRLSRETFGDEPVDLERLVREAVDRLRAQAPGAVQVQVESPLPAVQGYGPLIARIVDNLLGNACKFVGQGVTPHVRVRSDRRNGRVRLWIEDNGIGVPEQYRGRIFELFERLHTASAYPGTGVGLAIVQRAVERMGGACGVEASAEGSQFWVELPEAARVPAGSR